MDLLENCEECYQISLSEFPETIIIKEALDADADYIIRFKDKFDNYYAVLGFITADADGTLTVPIPDYFPEAWFNRNAGYFTIEVSDSPYFWDSQDFIFGGYPYPCIKVAFDNNNLSLNIIE